MWPRLTRVSIKVNTNRQEIIQLDSVSPSAGRNPGGGGGMVKEGKERRREGEEGGWKDGEGERRGRKRKGEREGKRGKWG